MNNMYPVLKYVILIFFYVQLFCLVFIKKLLYNEFNVFFVMH